MISLAFLDSFESSSFSLNHQIELRVMNGKYPSQTSILEILV